MQKIIKHYRLVLLLLIFLVQLAVPIYMIVEQRVILNEGKAYKFKTRPIDPYDPFRGRYVTLNFLADDATFFLQTQNQLKNGQKVYASLLTDDKGYAYISNVSIEKPESTHDFIRVEVLYHSLDHNYYIRLPFNRYYAPEKLAPEIEKAVWRRNNNQVEDVFALVKVYKGKSSLEELYINQRPAIDFVKDNL